MAIVAPTPHTPLPPAPSLDDPTGFDTTAEAFVDAQETFGDEMDALADNVYDNAVETAEDAETVAADRLSVAAMQLACAAFKAIAETGAASAAEATAAYEAFDHSYLGAKSADPVTDNGGGVLMVGAVYWNTVANELRVWNGAAFVTPAAGSGYLSVAGGTVTGTFAAAAALQITGDISPTQITSNQNDYNPTGLSGATVLRLSTDAARDITGLQGGADGRLISIVNVGSFSATLKDASGSSTAANRFDLGGDVTLGSKHGCVLRYDATASRWQMIGAPRASSAPDVILQDVTGSSTNAPALLDTVVRNVGSLASLASSRFTLPAGTYEIWGHTSWETLAAAFAVVGHAQIYNFTDSVSVGDGVQGGVASGSPSPSTLPFGPFIVTITSSKAFELRRIVQSGAAVQVSAAGVRSQVNIKRVFS